MKQIIVLNPEEMFRLDYEHNWKDLMTYASYLEMIAQRELFLRNQSGYERAKLEDLKNECELNSLESQSYEG